MYLISFEKFVNDIASIREYIKHINLINEVAKNNRESHDKSLKEFNTHLSDFRSHKKIFEYKSIVISLYGILEKHINIWMQEHIDIIPKLILRYDGLPDKIKENNFSLSIKLISLIAENRFAKYESLNKEDILIKLNNCLTHTDKYSLNGEAFVPLSGNLKHSKIIEAFKNLNINLSEKLKANKDFSAFLKTKYGDHIENKGNELFKTVDEIVLLRNDIAHGNQIDNILSITEFEHYIVFIEKYGKAIFESIVEKEIQYDAEYLYTQIKNIKGVYRQGSVLCFEIENTLIKKGDYIIVKTNDNFFLKKVILEIQIEGCTVDSKDIRSKINIGVNLENGISQNQTFFFKTSLT